MEQVTQSSEKGKQQQKTSVGRTKYCLEAWIKLTFDQFIPETIQGYHIEFENGPPDLSTHMGGRAYPFPRMKNQLLIWKLMPY